jgi:hypothetical protein
MQMSDDAGYSIHSNVFPRDRMIALLDSLEDAQLVRTKAGARQVLQVPTVRALGNDEAMLAIARSYVGPRAFPFRATLFDKSLDANWLVAWHQDIALPLRGRLDARGWGPWTIKGGVLHAIAPASALEQVIALRVHLDDSTIDNGPLRVLPGSHRSGILLDDQIDAVAAGGMAVNCVVDAGGVIAMRPLLLHASSKATGVQPRRVLHFEYAADRHFDHGIELAVS